jgi:glutaconate CoA-transferase subunit B
VGVSADDTRAATGWDLRIAADAEATAAPSGEELAALRELASA